ncbi:zf-HC2 domain-containing protein [Allorhizocola rhizosphaerae]|uniref:zf-HC2 domain-containing protein n=1 Tax=Allorhizocola rhizosphaerae TaxID=1872709 RepID=UPI000E3EB618|nr:zf-HC2 domain-containing protein [Allorhizocola rhizosphaerae]
MRATCDDFRVALSARLDGEQTGIPAPRIDAHLSECAACRGWLAAAQDVTRAVRLQSVDVPDLTAPILAAIPRPHKTERRRILQIALGLSAALQLILAIPVLLGVQDVGHVTREAASFDIALAVGFALAARWPERARAYLPVAFVLAGCLTLTSAFDIADGVTKLAHEVGHVAALAQAGLLWALSRIAPMRVAHS